jgi:hypothetical protein
MSHYSLLPNESHVVSPFPYESHVNPSQYILIPPWKSFSSQQEQDRESIEVRIDEIKLGILIWEFNL